MRQLSDKQLAANRENAKKSTGPRTDAGKRISRANALKHGLNSVLCVLSKESNPDFEDLAEAYFERFDPADRLEAHLLADIAAIHWNTRRIRHIENGLYEIEFQDPALLAGYKHAANGAQLVLAYARAHSKGLFALANRQLSRLSREWNRMMNAFLSIQQNAPLPDSDEQPPVPEAGPQQPTTSEPRITQQTGQNEPIFKLSTELAKIFKLERLGEPQAVFRAA